MTEACCWVIQVDAAEWREFQKLKEQLEQEKRDTAALTTAFVEHRAQTAADSLVRLYADSLSKQPVRKPKFCFGNGDRTSSLTPKTEVSSRFSLLSARVAQQLPHG